LKEKIEKKEDIILTKKIEMAQNEEIIEISADRILARTPIFKSYSDMTMMTNLNEAELSRNLEVRFLDRDLHDYMTYVG